MVLAALCFIKKGGKTLMLHRTKEKDHPHYGFWNGVGGKFERGETPEECIIREVKEETGFIIKSPELKGVVTFPEPNAVEPWYGFIFLAKEFKGKLIECDEGDLAWVDDGKIMSLPLLEGDKYFFPLLDKKGFFSAKLVYDGNKLLSHEVNVYV